MNLTLRLHQTSFSSNKQENLNKILHLLDASDAYLDVFPEYSMGMPSTGLDKKFVSETAETIDGEFIGTLIEKTAKKGTAIVFTTYLQEDDDVYNAAILAEKGVIQTVYRKIHLFDAFGYRESDMFTSGKELAIGALNGFKVGLAVCFDLRFPELFRVMARGGVNLFLVPSAWYTGPHKITQWHALTLVRAHENNAYLIAVDQTRPLFIGHSLAASPLGYIIQEAGEEPSSFLVNLDDQAIEVSNQLLPPKSLFKFMFYAGE